MRYNSKAIGMLVRTVRQNLGVTQESLALTSGTGIRFISDLEHGKPTCHLGKVLAVIQTLGIELQLAGPNGEKLAPPQKA